ncbi:MAG: DNA topoisomerase VI subunit B [Candidatus Thorarchaeota archaeon]|jgi:DNA topoisomerase-6 subunit B
MLTPRYTKPDVTELSVSAWFYRNRTLAGFDNPARSLYVSIRELVENSLDACEGAGILPEVNVRLVQEESTNERTGIASGPEVFLLSVQDNGSGIHRENITKLIGKMLTGTKFTHKQSRGTFGLGGSLALLYGQVTTQRPIEIVSGLQGDDHYSSISMRLDIDKNEPEIVKEGRIPKHLNDSGTTVTFHLLADWNRSKRRILDYFAQTSMIVPYSSIWFQDPDGRIVEHERVIDSLPVPAREVKPHPQGIDVELLKTMASTTRTSTLATFLTKSFQRIGTSTAKSFLSFAEIDSDQNPRELGNEALLAMMKALSEYNKFSAPTAKALSPAEEHVIQAGIMRLEPDFIATTKRSPSVYQGHPFIIEAAVAYGGQLRNGTNLYRFANRIPLLYDEGSDVSNRVIRDLKIKSYGFRPDDPLTFMVHICSTRVPYKTVGKEYIADVDAVRREISLGLKDCLRRLSEQVRRRNRVQKKTKRESRLRGYYKFIADTLGEVTQKEVSLTNLFLGDEV